MLYMIMDFEPGGELFSIIQKAGALTPKQAQTIAATLALVFEFCHNQHIVYRDLKPENIMIGPFGEVYVMDWGVAQVLNSGQDLEEDGGLVGTLTYISPEQAQGYPVVGYQGAV